MKLTYLQELLVTWATLVGLAFLLLQHLPPTGPFGAPSGAGAWKIHLLAAMVLAVGPSLVLDIVGFIQRERWNRQVVE